MLLFICNNNCITDKNYKVITRTVLQIAVLIIAAGLCCVDYVDNAALGIQSCSISIMQVQNASFKVTILKPELSDPSNSANANGHGIVTYSNVLDIVLVSYVPDGVIIFSYFVGGNNETAPNQRWLFRLRTLVFFPFLISFGWPLYWLTIFTAVVFLFGLDQPSLESEGYRGCTSQAVQLSKQCKHINMWCCKRFCNSTYCTLKSMVEILGDTYLYHDSWTARSLSASLCKKRGEKNT